MFQNLKKAIGVALLLSLWMSFAPNTMAATSILPDAADDSTCDTYLVHGNPDKLQGIIANGQTSDGVEVDSAGLLGCAIERGEVKFWMMPYIVNHALEFVIALAGLFVLLMILIGAYYYIAGGVTEDKEKGKKIITYALGGYALLLSSWILVNILLLALTI